MLLHHSLLPWTYCNFPSWFQAADQVRMGACQWAELISQLPATALPDA